MESVFVVKIDRLTRSIRDLCDIVELFARHNCALVSTAESIDTGTASGRMVLSLLGVLAQFEREQISERTSLSLGHLRRNKRPYGKVPFGCARVGNALVECARTGGRVASYHAATQRWGIIPPDCNVVGGQGRAAQPRWKAMARLRRQGYTAGTDDTTVAHSYRWPASRLAYYKCDARREH